MLDQVLINDAVAPFNRNLANVSGNGNSNENGNNESSKESPNDNEKDRTKGTKNPTAKANGDELMENILNGLQSTSNSSSSSAQTKRKKSAK